jgi:hypothetical protein
MGWRIEMWIPLNKSLPTSGFFGPHRDRDEKIANEQRSEALTLPVFAALLVVVAVVPVTLTSVVDVVVPLDGRISFLVASTKIQ